MTPNESLHDKECVVLLHGLARSAYSMKKLEDHLTKEGYTVANIGYPSRRHSVETLANIAIEQGIRVCRKHDCDRIHFVTHSLGGILVRIYLKQHLLDNLGRVVMLGPPNHGSEIVDNLKGNFAFRLFNGPAGSQLGTHAIDIPNSLGPVDFELGVIAGTRHANPLLSVYLSKSHDGKVSVASTRIEGMTDFLALPTMHSFMMRNEIVIEQTIYFLAHGCFQHDTPGLRDQIAAPDTH